MLCIAAIFALLDFFTLASGQLVSGNIIVLKWIISDLEPFWHIKRDSLTVIMNLVVTTVFVVVLIFTNCYIVHDRRQTDSCKNICHYLHSLC